MVSIEIKGLNREEVQDCKRIFDFQGIDIIFQSLEKSDEGYILRGFKSVGMPKDDIIYSMRLFNEKVDKLLSLSFIKEIKRGKEILVTLSVNVDNVDNLILTTTKSSVSDEAIDAFVLTIRFFIQDNEECSIRNIAKHYNNVSLPDNLVSRFIVLRDKLNKFLDTFSEFSFTYFEQYVDKDGETKEIQETLTRRQVLDLWVYGALSHANKIKKKKFDSLTSTPGILNVLHIIFVETLIEICTFVSSVKDINDQALIELEK